MSLELPRDRAHGQWRLLAPAVGVWIVAAATIHTPGAGLILAAAAGAGGVAMSVVLMRSRARPRAGALSRFGGVALVGCAALLVLGVRIDALERAREAPALRDAEGSGRQVEALVRIAGYPAPIDGIGGEQRAWALGRLISVSGDVLPREVPVLLWLAGPPEASWYPGAVVDLEGTLVRGPPEAQAAYEVRVGAVSEPAPRQGLREWTGSVAAQLRTTLRESALGTAGATLVPGLAVGDTSLIDGELDRVMLAASLTHLTAVSGSNCALVITAISATARRLGAGRRVRVLLSATALGGFVVVVGPDASVQRAAIMAAVLLVSGYGGKRSAALPALGLATFVLVIVNPWQAIQPGFALSVTATAGILLWANPIDRWLRNRWKMPGVLALPLAVAVVAQAVCAPLLLLLQPGLPIGGVLANVLAAPAAPLGTGLGLLSLLLLPLSPWLGGLALWCAVWPARWIEAAGQVGAGLPGSRWYWPGGWPGALLLAGVYVCLGVAALLASRRQRPQHLPRWLAPTRERGADRPGSSSAAVDVSLLAIRAAAGAAAGIIIAVVAIVPITVRGGVPRDWAVVACDVGQGDAVLLRDPAQPDQVVLVDTGDDPDLLDSCLDLFGVRRISLLVLTHDHRDHVGALDRVLARADAVLAPPAEDQSEQAVSLASRLGRAGVTVTVGAAGLRSSGFSEGNAGNAEAGLAWEVLGPPTAARHRDTNATSLLLRVRVAGLTVVLLGDSGETEQLRLVREYPGVTADIVKVAHHGSRDQAAGLYEQLQAKLALISVGEGNRYGHPTPALLEILGRTGTEVLRTDDLGSIAVRVTASGVEPWAAGERSQVAQQRRVRPRDRIIRSPRANPGVRRVQRDSTGATALARQHWGDNPALSLGCLRTRRTLRRRQRCRSRSSCT
ncbi:ComEC/Rec2 family competence protein [Leucobacter sp. BZR 635]